MIVKQVTLFKDGEPQCFCWLPATQVRRFVLLLGSLCKFAARFQFNVQFEYKDIEICCVK